MANAVGEADVVANGPERAAANYKRFRLVIVVAFAHPHAAVDGPGARGVGRADVVAANLAHALARQLRRRFYQFDGPVGRVVDAQAPGAGSVPVPPLIDQLPGDERCDDRRVLTVTRFVDFALVLE